MTQNLMFLFGSGKNGDLADYIQLVKDENEFYITFNNSSKEYADAFVAIKYCPLCGAKLE